MLGIRSNPSQKMHRFSGGVVRSLFGALVLSVLFCDANSGAQSQASSNDDAVQRLYTEAKAAEASGDFATAVARYESLLQIAPRLAPAYNNLGALYVQVHEFKKASVVLEKGLKIDPRMSSASALLGISLYELGDYSSAKPRLEVALRNNPKDDHAELFLANDLIKLGELNSAAAHLQQLVNRQPKNQELWYLLGKVHMKLSEQALAMLNELDPDSVWVYQISGEIMESMKNYEGALVQYKKAVALAPKQPGIHYLLGNAYWSLASWDNAAREFQAEIANDPSNCTAQWKIGNTMLEQRADPATALSNIDKALALCPSLAQARADRGRALLRMDRNEEAVTDLRAAEKISPEEPSIHFLLGQALRSLGRPAEAKVEMDIFTKLEENARAAKAERARQVLENRTVASPNP
jgi:Putative Zn-dependent protease, contains TPR repeats